MSGIRNRCDPAPRLCARPPVATEVTFPPSLSSRPQGRGCPGLFLKLPSSTLDRTGRTTAPAPSRRQSLQRTGDGSSRAAAVALGHEGRAVGVTSALIDVRLKSSISRTTSIRSGAVSLRRRRTCGWSLEWYSDVGGTRPDFVSLRSSRSRSGPSKASLSQRPPGSFHDPSTAPVSTSQTVARSPEASAKRRPSALKARPALSANRPTGASKQPEQFSGLPVPDPDLKGLREPRHAAPVG